MLGKRSLGYWVLAPWRVGRFTAASILILALGCASNPASHQAAAQPHTTPIPHVGINMGPERFTPFYLQFLAAYKKPLTIRTGVQSAEQAAQILEAARQYPDLSVLLLVEKPDLALVSALLSVKDAPALIGIELGNELDLQGLTAFQFSDFTNNSVALLTLGGYHGYLISGGIYTVDADTLAYAAPMLASLPCDAVFGVHLYGDASDPILAPLQAAAGCHQIAVTEYGMPSRTPQEDQGQAAYLTEQTAAFTRLGARFAIIYQLISGPSTSNLDNFGLLRVDNTPKPATFSVFN